MRLFVTPAACAPVAPSNRMAHLNDRRKKMPPEAKIAIRTYWGAVVAMDGAGLRPGMCSERSSRFGGRSAPGFLRSPSWSDSCSVGGPAEEDTILESAPFAGKRIDKFVVYVLFSPISLWFSDITFPKWGF